MNKLPRPGFGMRLLSCLLCLVLFVSLLAGILIADIRIITTKENISNIIREGLFTHHTVRPAAARPGNASGHGATRPVPQRFAMPKLAEDDTAGIMTDALVQFVYESMTEQYGELPITLEDVEKFVDESTLKDEISDLSASLINDLITGENTTVIDEEMVAGLVMDNAELIESYFGVTINEEEVGVLAEALVQNEVVEELHNKGIAQVLLESMTGGSTSGDSAQEGEGEKETVGGETTGDDGTGSDSQQPGNDAPIAPGYTDDTAQQMAELSKLMQDIRDALSVSAMAICFGVAAVCIILLLVLNRKWIWYPLRKIGFTMIWAALPLLLPTIIVIAMADFWAGLFLSMAVAGTIIAMILTMTAPVCMGAAGLGVVCVIVSFIIKAVCKHKVRKANAAAEAVVEAPAAQPLPELTLEVAEEAPVEEVVTEEAVAGEAPAEEVTAE